MPRHQSTRYDHTETEKHDRFLLFEDKREIELVWNGKSREVCTAMLPFQTREQHRRAAQGKRRRFQLDLLDTSCRHRVKVNGEGLVVLHAYFLGANDPYKSLKTTLKAEIDPDAWATLHSDTSRPFDTPKTGRIAVKVINHLGDEVMKVFRVS